MRRLGQGRQDPSAQTEDDQVPQIGGWPGPSHRAPAHPRTESLAGQVAVDRPGSFQQRRVLVAVRCGSRRSFAVILHYAAEAGHDVFGLSPQGTAWVAREATKRWRAWIAGGGGIRATQEVPDAKVSRKPAFRQPVRKIEVKQPISKVDLSRYDLKAGEKSLIEKAIAAGRFQGFSRSNLPGQQWKPNP